MCWLEVKEGQASLGTSKQHEFIPQTLTTKNNTFSISLNELKPSSDF